MTFTYIKFEIPKQENLVAKNGVIKSTVKTIIQKVTTSIFPIANPDLEGDINNVKEWYIEYDTKNDFTNKEVGLNDSGKPIVIFPWKENYGYWIDVDLKLENFYSEFNAMKITKEEFYLCWNEFEDRQ